MRVSKIAVILYNSTSGFDSVHGKRRVFALQWPQTLSCLLLTTWGEPKRDGILLVAKRRMHRACNVDEKLVCLNIRICRSIGDVFMHAQQVEFPGGLPVRIFGSK